MKFLISLVLLCIVIPLQAAITYVGGHLVNPKSKSIIITYYANALNKIDQKNSRHEINLDTENNFMFELDINVPLQYNLMNGNTYLFINQYAAPGDSLWFNFKNDEIDIQGNCEHCAGFLMNFTFQFKAEEAVNKEFNSSYKLDPPEFTFYWNKRRNAQLRYLDSFNRIEPFPLAFLQFMKQEIDYDYGVEMLQYTWRNPQGKKWYADVRNLSFLKEINVNNTDALGNWTYLHFISEVTNNLNMRMLIKNDINDPVERYYLTNQVHCRDSIAKLFFTGKVYDLSLYSLMKHQLRSLDYYAGKPIYPLMLLRTDSIINHYLPSFSDSIYAKRLNYILDGKKNIQRPAPDFTLKDLDGKTVKLSDFKGKVVYLDFWSTTCGPCVKEIPEANQLSQKYAHKNVVMLSIAFNKDVEYLRSWLKKNPFQVKHLIAPQGFASSVANDYGITSLPHYLIIDQQGMIVNEDAPRPGQKPEETIDILLK